jgi:fluoride exporter
VTVQIGIAIFVGGGLGALARYLFGLLAAASLGAAFPWGTLGVNIIGSMLIGFLAHILPAAESGGALWRLFLITGVLGGFTTFSAFSLETLQLVNRGDAGLAFVYVAVSVLLSLGAAVLGWSAGRLV